MLWAEMTWNAENGSKDAQLFLWQKELEMINQLPGFAKDYIHILGFNEDHLLEYVEARKSHLEKVVTSAQKEVKKIKLQRSKITKTQKTFFNQLEKNADKLNHYIGRNDRKSVRKLLDSYLPWAEMEPTEIQAWRTWLDAIETPIKGSEVMFRGLGDDYIAKGEKGPFLMSTLLTKNQGDYNRRLRSLSTKRQLLGYSNLEESNVKVSSLTSFMHQHSQNPVGSSFLSFSSFNVADGFSYSNKEKARLVAAVRVDPRRAIPNMISGFSSEKEVLVPLIVFPDEIVSIYNSNQMDEFGFYDAIEDKIGRKLTEQEKHGNSSFIDESLSYWKKYMVPKKNAPANFGPKSGLNCQQLLELFL
jgi:hypothetical protein